MAKDVNASCLDNIITQGQSEDVIGVDHLFTVIGIDRLFGSAYAARWHLPVYKERFVDAIPKQAYWAMHLRRDIYPGEISGRCQRNPIECIRMMPIEFILSSFPHSIMRSLPLLLVTNSRNQTELDIIRSEFTMLPPIGSEDHMFNATMDQVRCSGAKLFVGSPSSTFSIMIKQVRHHLPSCIWGQVQRRCAPEVSTV